jgi:hypothetical protein
VCAFFGIIHSPLSDERIDLPWRVLEQVPKEFQSAVQYQTPYHWAAAYALVAGLLLALSYQRLTPGSVLAAGDQMWADTMASSLPATTDLPEEPHR